MVSKKDRCRSTEVETLSFDLKAKGSRGSNDSSDEDKVKSESRATMSGGNRVW